MLACRLHHVLLLTVKVQCDGGIAFAQLVLGRHLVFTGILYGNIFDFKGGEVLLAIFLNRQLEMGKELMRVRIWQSCVIRECHSNVYHHEYFNRKCFETLNACCSKL
jgi:hypothetical protein